MTEQDPFNDPLFNEDNAIKIDYKTIKFGKVGDWLKGTLVDNTKRMDNKLDPTGGQQTVFQIKIHAGSIHNIVKKQIDAEPTVLNPGEFWSYITGKGMVLEMLKSVKVGQVVGLKFTESKPNKTPGFDDTKIIKVYPGNMDPEYQGESQETQY
jgi:hypothetical protein